MMRQLGLLLGIAILLSACVVGAPGHMYPVAGPLAAQTPVPIYKVSLTIIGPISGTLSATVQNGEACQGSLERIRPDAGASSNMRADWDRVYGQGFFDAQLLGNARARATLTGATGQCLSIELFNPRLDHGGAVGDIVGIARDDSGNVYKVTFAR